MRSQRGKNEMSKGRESRSEVETAESVERNGNIEVRVESESECCKSCSPKGQMLCMQKLKFESLVQRDKQGQKLKL